MDFLSAWQILATIYNNNFKQFSITFNSYDFNSPIRHYKSFQSCRSIILGTEM